jgi:hypothetical protein
MTTSWKRTETASGAGANALSAAFCVHAWPESRLVRALRWKQDAVCRETVSADATSVQTEADSTDSSLTRTIFFSSRIQTQPTTRKETPNTTQEKKGKQTKNQVTISQETETLA